MPKTSIFYYTNNLVPPKLLKHSFLNALKHCKDNNCELIVTSHYPITQSYTTVFLGNNNLTSNPIYQYIVNLSIPDSELEGVNIKNYVVGQLPYSHESIIKQILFSIDKCSSNNIILFEHDTLYPINYIPTVERFLNDYNKDMTYCGFNITLLNKDGYFNIENGSFVLGTCAFKKNIIKGIYERKLELIKSNKPYTFEPLLDIHSVHKRNFYKDEIIVKNHICIDTFLKDKCILDIKHNLNTDGMIIGENYHHYHSYWGDDKKYIDMINIDISENNQKLWNYGIGKLGY